MNSARLESNVIRRFDLRVAPKYRLRDLGAQRRSVTTPKLLGHLRPHILALDARHHDRLLHRIAPEGLAQLLIEDHLDECGDTFVLRLARLLQRRGQCSLSLDRYALQPASL